MMKVMRKTWGMLAAALSGVMLAMCYPGFALDGLVWVWAIPLMAALWIRGDKNAQCGNRVKWRGFGLGWLCGMVFWLINVSWLAAMGDLDGVPPAAANFAWVGLSAYLSLYFGIWGAVLASVGNPWRKSDQVTNSNKEKAQSKPKSRVDQLVEEKLRKADMKSSLAVSGSAGNSTVKASGKFSGGLRESLRTMRFALLAASLWVVLEWLRGWLFTGFGWSGVGVAFHDNATMAQSADLVGVIGLSFLPMLVSAMLLQLVWRMVAEAKVGKFRPHYEIAMSVGLVALAFVYGVVKIDQYKDAESIDVKVLMLQENLPQSLKWGDEAQQMRNYRGYAESLDAKLDELAERSQREAIEQSAESGEAVEQADLTPDVVIMPESSFTQGMVYVGDFGNVYLSDLDNDFLRKDLIRDRGFSVIYGSNLYEGHTVDERIYAKLPGEGADYNVIAISGPDSGRRNDVGYYSDLSIYGKVHLVPFGEFVPDIPFRGPIYGAIYGVDPQSAFAAGTSYDPLNLVVNGQNVGVIPAVCFEDTVGRVTRKFVRDEPQMIVNITNDGWFGKSLAAEQHMANAKFRAIELRRPMLRSANTGVSGIIDMTGSVVDVRTKQRQVVEDAAGSVFVRDALFGYARVPVDPQWTLYAMLGDWFVWFCLALFMMTVFLVKLNK